MLSSGTEKKESDITNRLLSLIEKMSQEEQQTLLMELEERLFGNKRTHVRKPYFSVVDFATKEGIYKDFIQDISAGGVFIQTPMPFSVGQDILMTFPLPISNEHIRITGEIVRISDRGIGVKFYETGNDVEQIIKDLLDKL